MAAMNNPLPCIHDDETFREGLIDIRSREDIPKEWSDTPAEAFIMSQNFGWPIQASGKPELLICACIEFRYALPIPRMYAYVIRRASGRVIGSEFSVAYTLAKGINTLMLIGHNDCGMAKVEESKPALVDALVHQGWDRELATAYVEKHGNRHAIKDELGALKDEYLRVRSLFPKLLIAPMFVSLFDSKLYLPRWYPEVAKMPVPEHVSNDAIASLP
jgi:carbonic anhydrase